MVCHPPEREPVRAWVGPLPSFTPTTRKPSIELLNIFRPFIAIVRSVIICENNGLCKNSLLRTPPGGRILGMSCAHSEGSDHQDTAKEFS